METIIELARANDCKLRKGCAHKDTDGTSDTQQLSEVGTGRRRAAQTAVFFCFFLLISNAARQTNKLLERTCSEAPLVAKAAGARTEAPA